MKNHPLSRGDLEEIIRIAKARGALLDELQKALEANDEREVMRLARKVCGMDEGDDERLESDRRNPTFIR
jgi:hypothetical protein